MTAQSNIRGLVLAATAALIVGAPLAASAQPYSQYEADQARYEQQRQEYMRARADYDRRYGDGSYDRYYPTAAETYRSERQEHRDCRREKSNNGTAGALLGGIAGAVIGSNLASGGGRTGGAIIGGVGGAALGNGIAKGQATCDDGR